jgi:hypothetical protein
MAKSEAISDVKKANAAVFYRAFCSMDLGPRRRLLVRFLEGDPVFLEQYIRQRYNKLRRKAIGSLKQKKDWKLLQMAELFRIHKASVSRISRGKQGRLRERQWEKKQT